MKKLSELKGDQFMDAFNALCPLIPVIESIDINALYEQNGETLEVSKINAVQQMVKIITRLLPIITSKEHRKCVWEVISILDEKSIEEIKEYEAPKLIFKIRKIFAEGELTNFLSYVEKSDTEE